MSVPMKISVSVSAWMTGTSRGCIAWRGSAGGRAPAGVSPKSMLLGPFVPMGT